MSKSTDRLNELIKIARDGRQFYLDAARNAQDPELRDIFRNQADLRELLIEDLSENVAEDGDTAARDQTLAGRTRKLYSAFLASLSKDREGVYLSQLEEVEDRLLEHYRQAMDEVETEKLHRTLTGYLPTVEAAHDRMKELGRQKRAA